MRYPFTPDVLADLPEELAELFQNLEDTLLYEICSRLKLTGDLNEVTVQDIRALRSYGVDLKDIEKAIKDTTGIAGEELNKLFDDVVERNRKYYADAVNIAKLTQPSSFISAADVAAIIDQCQREFGNITRSMGFLVDNGRTMLQPAKAYQWACDSAVLQIQSGAISYNQAIKSAVQQLADSGLKTVDYESGATSSVDVAVRRAVMTGVNQLNRKYTENSMHFLQTDIVEVSAHPGARDTGEGFRNHKAWQGKLYRWAEFSQYYHTSKKHYPDFQEACGYGDVQGILGANCRHSFSAFVEGVMQRAYADEELEHIDDGLGCEYDGKKYNAYEATQMQRRLERTIRKQKRRVKSYKAAGLTEDEQTANIKLRRLETKYTEFSKAAGLPEQVERKNISFVGEAERAEAQQLKVQRDAEAPIRADIKSGKYPLEINLEKQSRHMAGTAIQGRSVVTVSMEELQEIVNTNAGSGKINLTRDFSAWKHTEIIAAGKEIGYTVNEKGEKKAAYSLKIHYSGTGTHAVPFSGWWKK